MSELENLKKASSLNDLATLLGYKPHTLSYILYKIPNDKKYTAFSIPKKGGGTREIKAPTPHLKELQKRLADLLAACIQEIDLSKDWSVFLSHGFKKNHSIVTNGQKHKKSRYVFNIDLSNFFPSINFGRVRGFFIKNKNFKLDPKVATIIAQIACHDNQLPQGSPCSPVISNLIGHLLDIRLAKFARSNKCTYTRYADDITFSSNSKKFPNQVGHQKIKLLADWIPGKKLEHIIQTEGFFINHQKTRMQYKNSRQLVTGLVVNKKVNVKSEYYRKARSMCHSLFRTGQFYHVMNEDQKTPANQKNFIIRVLHALYKKILRQLGKEKSRRKKNEVSMARLGNLAELEGILSHIYYVKKIYDDRARKSHNSRVQKSHNTLTLQDKEGRKEKVFSGIKKLYFKFLFYKNFYGLEKPLIICEGKTDYAYLRCALKKLSASYPKLIKIENKEVKYNIRFFNYSETTRDILFLAGGAPNLANLIRHYKDNIRNYTCTGKNHPVIIVVDNDSGSTEKKSIFDAVKHINGELVDGTKPFYFVTDNLYVVPTPKLDNGDDSKIEDFFHKDVLSTEIAGKKFNPKNKGMDSTKEYGKHIFAEEVIKKNKDKIDFSGFKKILDPICLAIDDYTAMTN